MHKKDRFISTHFTLQALAEGVYAALHKPGGGAIANAGIVDLGECTLVFDTFISHLAARELCLAAELMTGNPVAYVINSHYHNDHIRGNQAFKEAQIIATQETIDLLHTAGQAELEWDTHQIPARLEEYKAQFAAAQDDQTRDRLRFWLDTYQTIVDSLPRLEIKYQERTFADHLILEGSQRRVEVISYGPAHTGSDAILWLPQEKIAFLADLLFVGCHPYLPDGDPQAWIAILAKIKNLQPKTLVPGHGPQGRVKDLELMVAYINLVIDIALQKTAGVEISLENLPHPFREWEFSLFFPANLAFIEKWNSSNPQSK